MSDNLKCYKCKSDTGSPYVGVCLACHEAHAASLKCAAEGCKLLRRDGGKSKYCPACAKVARANWRDNVAASAAKREEQDALFARAWTAGEAAAATAALAAKPTPMVVYTPKDGNDAVIDTAKPVYYESDGACGFAWVKVRPANAAFANWCKRTGKANRGRDYDGGLTVSWCPAGGTQSMARHEAAARAMAETITEVLKFGGVPVREGWKDERKGVVSIYSQSRMD
jgi:hypothetical protein